MDILNQLRELTFRLNRDDISSVQALLKRITGDQIATIMLTRLLYWLPKSTTGWVYKSWRDWEAECGLTRAQVKRVHSSGLLEAVGVQRELRKARGAPTVHYRVDLVLLFAKIADHLGIAVDEITMSGDDAPLSEPSPIDRGESTQPIGHKSANGLSGNGPMDWSKTAQSITEKNIQEKQRNTDNTEQQQQTVAAAVDPYLLDRLVGLGLSKPLAQILLNQYDTERVRVVLGRSQDTGIHNPAGFVRRALLENWIVSPQRVELRSDDPMRYVRGEFADLIQH